MRNYWLLADMCPQVAIIALSFESESDLSLITSEPGLGPSCKESRPPLTSADHLVTVEYLVLYTSAMLRWISLAFAPLSMRNL